MLVAFISDYEVKEVKEVTDEEYSLIAPSYQMAWDVSNTSPVPQVGWKVSQSGAFIVPNVDPILYIKNAILLPAKSFGQYLIDKNVSENIAMGITQAGKTRLIGEAAEKLSFWLSNGSLYEARAEIAILKANMNPAWAPFITDARLTTMDNELKVYLKIP